MTDAHVTIPNTDAGDGRKRGGYQPSGLVAAAVARGASLPAGRIRQADRLVAAAAAGMVGHSDCRRRPGAMLRLMALF